MIALQILALAGAAIANAEVERGLTDKPTNVFEVDDRRLQNEGAHSSYAANGRQTRSMADPDTEAGPNARMVWSYDPCIDYDNYGKCVECKSGYIVTKFGECKEEIKHCIEYDMIGNCKKCDGGFFEGRGTCHKIIVGCIKYDPWVFNCQKCDEGWFFELDACHKEIKHCDRYNKKYWYCEHCLWPYESTGFQCVPSQYSSYSGGWGRLLTDKPTNVFEVDDRRLQNEGAHSSYAANGRQTRSMADPDTGAGQNSRMLWGFDPCIEYNSFGHCKDCKDGYYLTKFGECKEEIKHCVEYNMIGNCEKCDPGYFVGKGTCHKIIKGCVKYDQDVFNCQKCDEGWFFENEECHREIKHCDRYNKKFWYCEHCLWPYRSVGSACIKW